MRRIAWNSQKLKPYQLVSFVLFQLPGYQGEEKTFIMFYLIKVKKLLGDILIQFYCLPSTTFLLFHFKGSKILNGGSEAQDTNQSQHNGENAEEKKDRHEAGSKKK